MSLLPLLVVAQDIVVIGQVLSAYDATPLAAANVWFKGTAIGTTTNEEGFFMLRSPKPQRTLVVSVVGYRKRNIQLDYGKDQMVEVLLREESSILDEIVVMARQDDAHRLLGRVRANKTLNDPSNVTNIAVTNRHTMYANVTNIRGAAFRRRLFADLESGAIAQSDTNYSLPMYALSETQRLTVLPDSTTTETTDVQVNAVDILEKDNWRQLLENYTPKVNPYRSYTTILGSNFLNPIAPNASSYYNIYIADSTCTATGKQYQLSFKPKRDDGLLFRGTMTVDSTTAAITGANWNIPSYTPINFLKNFSYHYTTSAIDSLFLPLNKRQMTDLELMANFTKKSNTLGTIITDANHYTDYLFLADTITRRINAHLPDTVDLPQMQAAWAGIDSINQTRIRRLASWAVDIILNQYLHIWKIDLGPIPNLYHFNQLEGNSPRISLRSGKSFSKNFTFGGYYGYGFKDRQHKYGGQVQWKFGSKKRHYLAFHYDHRVERYGYDDILMYDENRVHDVDHMFTSFGQIHSFPIHAMRKRMRLEYVYEQPGLRIGSYVKAENIYANRYLPYIQNGQQFDCSKTVSVKADVRLSWKERTLDEYFHRIYLKTPYPVVRMTAEMGGVSVGQQALLYGKFDLYAHQNVPVGFGKLCWWLRGSAIVGDVPWSHLTMVSATRINYFADHDFALINKTELAADLFAAAHLRYTTRGYIFGYIPGVKKLGIREDLVFKIGYGRLRPSHNNVLQMPATFHPWHDMPYIEAGFGLSNILHIADIHFMWRITHRDNPNAQNFGILWRINLGF